MTTPRAFHFEDDDDISIRHANLLRKARIYTNGDLDDPKVTREYLMELGWRKDDIEWLEDYMTVLYNGGRTSGIKCWYRIKSNNNR